MSCSVCAGYDSQNCPCCGEEVRMITCPECGGTGKGNWMVFDIYKRTFVKCTEFAYLFAADDEDKAEELHQRYCKQSCTCLTCQGEGQIPV